MIRRPPRATRTYTLFPYTTLFRSGACASCADTIAALPNGALRHLRISDATHSSPAYSAIFFAERGVRSVGSCSARFCLCRRSEEHTSELQSLMRISYAVFCLKKKNTHLQIHYTHASTHITR